MPRRLAIVALLCMVGAISAAVPAAATRNLEPAAASDELLVAYEPGTTAAARGAARARAGAHFAEQIVAGSSNRLRVDLVTLRRGSDRGAAARALASDPAVAYAEPNYKLTADATSDDPYYTDGTLWGMYGNTTSPSNSYGSQAAEAWAAGKTGDDAVYVGIIDTGIDASHPDIAGNIWSNPGEVAGNGVDDDSNGFVDDVHGFDFYYDDGSVFDDPVDDDHGTHVAGTIGGLGGNGVGVAGVAWNVTMISGKFLGPDGGYTADAVRAIDYFIALKNTKGLNIVALNNSWGGGGYSTTLFNAITRAQNAGMVFVAAAGNSARNNDSIPHYPSSYSNSNVVAVASITSSGARSSFSNYGATSVDLGAPGSAITSTLPNNAYGSFSGTSMATPHVTGAVALFAADHPGSTAAQLKAAVLNNAVPTSSLSGRTVTGGRLNVSAMLGIVDPTPPTPFTLTARGYRVKGVAKVDLSWSGAGGSVDVFRGTLLRATVSGTTYTDSLGKGSGTFTYKVCNAGTTTCSNTVTVIF